MGYLKQTLSRPFLRNTPLLANVFYINIAFTVKKEREKNHWLPKMGIKGFSSIPHFWKQKIFGLKKRKELHPFKTSEW